MIAFALLLTLSTPPAPSAVRLEDVCGGDCPAYGEGGDWSDVVTALLESPTCAPKASGHEKRRGCAIRLGCAEYRFTRPWDLCRGVTIRGCGEGALNGGTTLVFARDVDGFRTWYSVLGGGARCPTLPDNHVTAGHVAISDLYMRGELGAGARESTTSKAIFARTPVRLSRVTAQGFGHLLHVKAAHPDGNANGWSAYDLSGVQLGSWGVYIEGADANVGRAVGLNIAGACRRAGTWDGEDKPTCWGIRDRSSFGTTFVAPHVAYLWDVDVGHREPKAHHPGYVAGESPTAVALLLNPYQETGGRDSVLLGNTTVIGGVQRPRSPNVAHWRGRAIGGAITVRGRGASTGVVHLGDVGRDTAMMVEIHGDRASNVRLQWDRLSSTWVWRAGGAGAGELAVTGYRSKTLQGVPLVPGRSWLGRSGDAYVGPPNRVTRILYGAGPKPPPCGLAIPAGSRWLNMRPARGEALEWVCVCASGERPQASGVCGRDGKTWRAIH